MKGVTEYMPPDETKDSRSDGVRPEINVNNRHLRDLTDETLEALQASNNPPYLFTRSGLLVRAREGKIEALTASALKGVMDRAADYVKINLKPNGKDETQRSITPARPPADVAPDILALQSLPFPELHAITRVPQVLPDGTILARDGYDPKTGILLHLEGLGDIHFGMPLGDARALIVDDLLGDFPFANSGARAHAVAMLLQSFVMPLITGATPLYLIDAPTRGTGKTLLYLVVAHIVLGGEPPVMTLTRDGDELDKRITASLLEGDVMMVLDNVTTRLGSDKLAAVLTSRAYRGRRLGKSEMLTVPNDATWVATGNNVEVSDEIARRIMPIRLDAGLERPEVGREFRHPYLLMFVKQNRSRLVSACLSIIHSWVVAGMPQGQERIGSFESWAAVMGGILTHAGIPGLLGGRERFEIHADRETTEWGALCEAWWETYGGRPINASELFETILKDREFLMDVWAGRNKLSASQRIGWALSARRDRVFGEYVIRDAGRDSKTRNAAYRLERTTPHETPETPGRSYEPRQGHKNAPGVLSNETPAKHSETPGNTPQNTQGINPVPDVDNSNGRVFRVFELRSPENDSLPPQGEV